MPDHNWPHPNVFFVGAAKSGTTALTDFLNQHPAIYARKEPHFFAEDIFNDRPHWMEKAHYQSLYADADKTPVRIDASVNYLFSKIAAARIYDFCPEAKILIQLRNPLEVIAAHHNQLVYEGAETETDFEKALCISDARSVTGQWPGHFLGQLLDYRAYVHFAPQVRRFLDVFPEKQVQVTLFDDFKKNPLLITQETYRFLGVDAAFKPEISVVNANKKVRSRLFMDMFVKNPPAFLSAIAKFLLPAVERARLKQWIRRTNTKTTRRRPVPAWMMQQLAYDMANDIEALGDLIGRDLSHWYVKYQNKQSARDD